MVCNSICGHGNLYEECAQCDSDARLGVDSSILDQVPDCKDDEDAEYESWLNYFDSDPEQDFDENDDPDGGLDDPYCGYGNADLSCFGDMY